MLGKIWTRSINRSLLCLLSIIFDCWEENFAREKPKPPSFSFLKRTDSLALQAQLCSLHLSHQFCFAHPPSPLSLRSPGKNFLDKKERKKKKIWISLISDLSRPLYNIHLFWAAFDTSFHPPLLGISRGLPPCAPFLQPQGAHYNSVLIQSTIASNEGRSLGMLQPGEMHTFCLWQQDESHELELDTNLSALGKRSC